jgi:hypothetical protein
MEKELLERVALEQREYWKRIAKETGQRGWSQAVPGEPSLGEIDPNSLTPADWQHYWGRFVAPELS